MVLYRVWYTDWIWQQKFFPIGGETWQSPNNTDLDRFRCIVSPYEHRRRNSSSKPLLLPLDITRQRLHTLVLPIINKSWNKCNTLVPDPAPDFQQKKSNRLLIFFPQAVPAFDLFQVALAPRGQKHTASCGSGSWLLVKLAKYYLKKNY